MVFPLIIGHVLENDLLWLLMLLPLPLSEVHTVMVLVSERLFEMTVAISLSNFETYLIIVKIRGPLILFLHFVSMSISTFDLLGILKSYVSLRTLFIRIDALP